MNCIKYTLIGAVSALGLFSAQTVFAGSALLGIGAEKTGTTYNPRIYGPQEPSTASARTVLRGTVNDPDADTTSQDTQSSVALATVGGGKIVAAFNDTGSYSLPYQRLTGYAFSANGGTSWIDGGTTPAFNPTRANKLPALAADPALGRVYLAGDSYGVGSVGLAVWRSTNGGQTWASSPADGTGGTFTSGGSPLAASIAVDTTTGAGKSNVYLCYRDMSTGHIRFTRSTNKGVTFTPPGGLDLGPTGAYSCTVAVGPQHDVYVFFVQTPALTNQLVMRRSTNGGATFGPAIVVRNLLTPLGNAQLPLNGIPDYVVPSVGINPSAARPYIYVAYNDGPNAAPGADNGNIYVVYSKDRGATWSAPVVVDAAARDQFMPAIGFASAENLMVTYNSRIHDPANSFYHRRARIGKLAASGAIAFNAPFQLGPNSPNVSSQDMIPALGPFEVGWRETVIGSAGKFLTAWSDSRTGDAFHTRQPDVRFASIAAPVPNANLGVTLTSSTAAMTPLETRIVKAHVTSAGGASNDAFLNVIAPVGMKISPPTGLDCTVTGQFLGCALGSIPAGQARDVFFTVQADGTSGVRKLTAQATTSSRDTVGANNNASITYNVLTGAGVTATYSTGNIAVAIPDTSAVDIPITVPNTGTVLDAKVAIRINHTFDADLDIYLVDPTGKTIELSTDNGSGSDNYGSGSNDCSGTPTVFDGTASTNITAGVAPFAGSYAPEAALSGLLGQASNGIWNLHIADDLAGDTGTVGCVKLTLTRKP